MAFNNKFANTKAVSIGQLLSQKQLLKVPRFQRNYDWDKEKVGALLTDLLESFDLVKNRAEPVPDAQYLFGPMVLVTSKEEQEFLVIDGQQRLATLTMLFCVVRDIMYEYNQIEGVNKIDNLLLNKSMGQELGWKLELNDTDKDLFNEIQKYEHDKESQAVRFKNKKFKTKSNKLLVENYNLLHEKLLLCLANDFAPNTSNSTSKDYDEHRETKHMEHNIPLMSYFIDFVCDYNYVVLIMVDDDNTAFQIFETLNERGQTLSKSNLIKNHILNKIKTLDMQKKQSDRWNNIFDKVIGNNQQDDEFIMESYYSRHKERNSLRLKYDQSDNSEPKLSMSKKNLYKIIKKIVTDEKSCEDFIKELETDAEYLSGLSDPSQYFDEDSKDDVHVIKILKAKFIRVPLLAAYRQWYVQKPNDYSKLVQFLVKFFFKVRVIRKEHPGDIKKIIDVIVGMINSGDSYQAVIDKLKKYDDHEDFVYNFKKFMEDPKKDAVKYILQQISIHLGTKYDDVRPIDDLTLEHILPQNSEKWDMKAFFAGYDGESKIDEFKNRLGNLTLLHKVVNTNNSNLPFSIKKFQKDSNGVQIGYVGSKLEINQQTVCNYDEWTANIIKQREDNFAKYADQIWNLN